MFFRGPKGEIKQRKPNYFRSEQRSMASLRMVTPGAEFRDVTFIMYSIGCKRLYLKDSGTTSLE